MSEIAEILDADTPERVRAAVERHRGRVATQAARLAEIAVQLGTVLDGPRSSDWLHVYERWRDRSPTARIVVHSALRGLAEVIGTGYAELFARVGEQRIAIVGPAGCRYLSNDPAGPDLEVELFVPVERKPRPAGRMSAGELPGCLLAATVYQGAYDAIDTAYHSLGRWIAEHSRSLSGPAEELYIVPPGPGVPAEALRTEVAWPVATLGETA